MTPSHFPSFDHLGLPEHFWSHLRTATLLLPAEPGTIYKGLSTDKLQIESLLLIYSEKHRKLERVLTKREHAYQEQGSLCA